MNTTNEPLYSIPARYRRLENMHIAFWLLKDISWCMIWKPFGMAMIVPTLAVAIWFTYRNKHIAAELAHNLAIVFWITANSYWMISEFLGFDEMPLWRSFEGKHLALIPFITGVLILLYYYIIQRPQEKKQEHQTAIG